MIGLTSMSALLIVTSVVCGANKIPISDVERVTLSSTAPPPMHQEESLCDINVFASHHRGVVAVILIFALVGLVTIVILILCMLKHRCFCKDDGSRYRDERVQMNEIMWS